MNRKQRRAAAKPNPPARAAGAEETNRLFAEAVRWQRERQFDRAALAYKRLLGRKPDHAEAANNLGCLLHAQGRMSEASAWFARALELTPQLFNDFAPIGATLAAILPPFAGAARRAMAAWPKRPPLSMLLDGAPLATIAADPLLLTILRSSPVRDVAFERALTALRSALLEQAVAEASADKATLAFACALAEQCFINEYVFATTAPEEDQIAALIRAIETKLAAGAPIPPFHLAALGMYQPLHHLAGAEALLDRPWPAPLAGVLTQQIREPRQERALRASIPRLTPIGDDVSRRVRQQYEENPYPRWVRVAAGAAPMRIEAYLTMTGAACPPLPFGDTPDVLVAGCGAGSHPIELAGVLRGARLLAVDLSLSSLAYAKRKTPPELARRIEYAQADILQLGDLDRSFDVVDASGVLHHMAEPAAGLRALLQRLRPGGLMRLGLYSEAGRREIAAARDYVAQRGYKPTVEDIRRARQDLLDSDLRAIAAANDFFTVSECRDLLFHVQEHRMTIPQIKSLLAESGLRFIGFVFDPPTARRYADAFARDGKAIDDLDAWHAFEARHPGAFRGMYQFWCQKG